VADIRKGTSPFNLKDFFDKAGRYFEIADGNSAEFWRRDGKELIFLMSRSQSSQLIRTI
jgi:hypothetical protein